MSYIECNHCGESVPLSQASLVEQMSQELGVPFLGSIPFDPDLKFQRGAGEKMRPFFENIAESLLSPLAESLLSPLKV